MRDTSCGYAEISRRGARIILLTALLTTIACGCGGEAVEGCSGSANLAPCAIPMPVTANCTYTFTYVPGGADCTDCSDCRQLQMTTISASTGNGVCIDSCKQVCPPPDTHCASLDATAGRPSVRAHNVRTVAAFLGR
jgi:hypothetical protein